MPTEDQMPDDPQLEEEARDRDVVEQQDFAARNVIMSNALPSNPSPAAGAITADRELGMEPTPEDARAGETEQDSSTQPD
jgi:hypothetical protein